MKGILLLVLLAAFPPPAYSQVVLYTFNGTLAGDQLGGTVSAAGDVNADGVPDVIVGGVGDDTNGYYAGAARVYSGLDGSLLYSFYGDSVNDYFGGSASGAGDVNGDGFDDLIVGAAKDDNNGDDSGSARVYSGLDGSVLYAFDGDYYYDWFGNSVSGAGDVNGDGFDDVVVGAFWDDNNGSTSGSARVFSGVDGSVLYTFNGDSPGDEFGFSVSGAGDVNGDGFDDLIVGARYDDNNGPGSGSARVLSGVDGSVLYTFNGDSAEDWFGYSVSDAGDVNGDGFADLIVGAARDDNNGNASGSARVFSGADGSILYTFDGDDDADIFGRTVSGAGDVNGDGFDDLLVGSAETGVHPGPGYARVFSGHDGSILFTLYEDSPGDNFGCAVSGAGDMNGDGFADLIVGASWNDNTAPGSGSATVFAGCGPLGTVYCSATVNSTGMPAMIRACGSPSLGSNNLRLRTTDVAPNQWGYYMMSQTKGFIPNVGGTPGNICLGGKIIRFTAKPEQILWSGPEGVSTYIADLTDLPQNTVFQPGETWNFQLWFRDNVGTKSTSNFSDGVSITFQ